MMFVWPIGLEIKQDGQIKGRICADGHKQRKFISKE